METIATSLKLADLKRRNLHKSHEQLHSEASSFLLFSLEWKDLEEHFDSIRELVQLQYKEIEERENKVSLKEKHLENAEKLIDELSHEVETKRNELSKLDNLIDKCDAGVRLKEKELNSAQERLRDFSRDIKLKDEELNTMCLKIVELEKEIKHKDEVLDTVKTRVNDCERECKLKEQKLNELKLLIEERSVECELKENDVESVRMSLQEYEKNLAITEERYKGIQIAIKEMSAELNLKEKEVELIHDAKWKEKRLGVLEKSIKLRTQELDFKENEFGLMQSKLKDLSEDLSLKESESECITTCIKKQSEEFDMQEKKLDSIKRSILDYENEAVLLIEYVSLIRKAIIECSKELEFEENHLSSLQKAVYDNPIDLVPGKKQHSDIRVTVEKCLEDLKAQKKQFNLLRKSMEERSQKLKNQESDFEILKVELNKKGEEVSKRLIEIELNERDIASQMKLLKKGGEIRSKDKQGKLQGEKLEFKGEESEKLEFKGEESDSIKAFIEKCTGKENPCDNSNIPHLKVKTEELDFRPANTSNRLNFRDDMIVDGKILLFLLCEHLKVHDFVRSELAGALKRSSHPAKLVLDALRYFYPSYSVTEDTKFYVYNIRRGCILLSELLLKLSPQITPVLKEEALMLAGQWKAKMTVAAENHVEVVAFLLLVANFRLTPEFNLDELCTLLKSVSHYKQAVDLGQALGIPYRSPVGGNSDSSVQIEQPQSLPHKAPVSSLKNGQFSTNPDERRVHLLLNEQLNGLELMPSAILLTLKMSSDPAKVVLDVVEEHFHHRLKKENIGFDENSFKWFTLLLKQLMLTSQHIDLRVKGAAMKLAVSWKSKIKTDRSNSLEIVCFLQLLVSYDLTTSFSGGDLLKLFEIIVLHEDASELCSKFGFTQKIIDLVRSLIKSKQIVKAVGLICGYKLECFHAVQVLNEYLLDARNATLKIIKSKKTNKEKDEAIDKEIDVVKSVIRHFGDLSLGPEMSSQVLDSLIMSLEEMRANKIASEPKKDLERRNKCCQQPQPTNVGLQHLHSASIESQQHQINLESQQWQPWTKSDSQQRHLSNDSVQKAHSTKFKEPQPQPTKAEAPQPQPTNKAEAPLQPQRNKTEAAPHLQRNKTEEAPQRNKTEEAPLPQWNKTEVPQPQPKPTKDEVPQPKPTKDEVVQPLSTKAEAPRTNSVSQQRHLSNDQAQRPYRTKVKEGQPLVPQQTHSTKAEAPQPHITMAEAPQPRTTKAESPQPRTTKAEAPQPRTTKAEAPQPRWKKRKNNYQNNQMKCPRTSPSARPFNFRNSTHSFHDEERSKFWQNESRFAEMHGLFDYHEAGHGFTEHVDHYLRPPWPSS